MRRALAILLLAPLSACRLFQGDSPSIAGQYALARVDGQSLPCCGQNDASGVRWTTLSGTLILGDAASESFVITPAGYYPASCVYEVPNGSVIGQNTAPRCGDGDFSLTLVQRADSANGSSFTSSVVTTGRYAWSEHDAMIKLVDVPMLGSATLGSSRALQIQKVNVQGTYGPTYTFTPAAR